MTDTQQSGKPGEMRKLAWVMIAFVTALASLIVLLCEIFAPQIVEFTQILSMSHKGIDPARMGETVDILRIMLPIILMVSLWGLMGGILNALDNFIVPGLAPLIWNMTIIVVPLLFGDREQIANVAIAFVVGHFLQMAVHLPWIWKAGIFGMVKTDWRHPMLRRFLILAPARNLAYAAPSINVANSGDRVYSLGEKPVSFLYYSFRLQQLPMAVFGVSVATALFPRSPVTGPPDESKT